MQKGGAGFGHAIAIGIAQQGDAVGRWHTGTGALHHQLHDPAFDALGVLGLGRRVALGHQHVAVGQHLQPARVVKPGGQRGHAQAVHWRGAGVSGPALRRRNVHGGQQR